MNISDMYSSQVTSLSGYFLFPLSNGLEGGCGGGEPV